MCCRDIDTIPSIFLLLSRCFCSFFLKHKRTNNTKPNTNPTRARNHHTSLSRLTRGVKKKNCLKMMQRKANPTMRSTAALINSANAKRCIETSFFFSLVFFTPLFFCFFWEIQRDRDMVVCLRQFFLHSSLHASHHAALEIRAESIFFFLLLLIFLLQSVVFVSIVDDARDFFFTFFVVVVFFPNIFV